MNGKSITITIGNHFKTNFINRKQCYPVTCGKKKSAIDQIPSLKWSIITVLPGYSNITKCYQLCLYEKYAIITYPDPENLLNKRSEIMSKCPHQPNVLLSNYDARD